MNNEAFQSERPTPPTGTGQQPALLVQQQWYDYLQDDRKWLEATLAALAKAVIDEEAKCVGPEGPSWTLVNMASSAIKRAIAASPKCATCSALFVHIGDGYVPACVCHMKETRNVSMD